MRTRADIPKKASFFAPECLGRLQFSRRALLLLVLLALHFSALAQERPEYEVKTLWLYNILKSTDWPAEAFANKNAPVLVLGVLGKDPFGNFINGLTNKIVAKKPIVIKRYKSVQEVQGCHVVFISASESSALPQIFEQLRNSPMVTVGETAEFTKFGGMINLSLVDPYKFEFSKKAWQKSGLKIDSRFLASGKSVP